ncbi:hypothetical protein [Marinobacter sp. GH_1]|uniref:hypothetical protein n=1 Tax=Marinobacter sp. GH_1 TaxID=3402164 RepID=UPI003B438FF1
MANLTYKERILKIAEEILAMRPGTHPKAALREAKAIAKTRQTYRVSADQKKASHSKTDWDSLPEHVKATISKQKAAEAERRKSGRQLEKTKIVSGGGVSPR